MSVLIRWMQMPRGCVYENDKGQTGYCPMLNHDDVPFCQFIENEPEAAIGIEERPVYCPLIELPDKHGRLVDADEIIDNLTIAIPYFIDDDKTDAYAEGLNRAKIEIDDSPTIIEQEGKG